MAPNPLPSIRLGGVADPRAIHRDVETAQHVHRLRDRPGIDVGLGCHVYASEKAAAARAPAPGDSAGPVIEVEQQTTRPPPEDDLLLRRREAEAGRHHRRLAARISLDVQRRDWSLRPPHPRALSNSRPLKNPSVFSADEHRGSVRDFLQAGRASPWSAHWQSLLSDAPPAASRWRRGYPCAWKPGATAPAAGFRSAPVPLAQTTVIAATPALAAE